MTAIVIVGEAYGEKEEEEGKPFVGSSGWMLDSLLSQAGLSRTDCAVTNVFNLRPPRNDVEALMTRERSQAAPGFSPYKRGLYLPAPLAKHVAEMFQFIAHHKPNVVLALGNTALWALTGTTGILKWRGSTLPSKDKKWKVLPTIHPSAILRQWELRAIAFMDFTKLAREATYPEVRRPERFIHLTPSLAELEELYFSRILPAPFVACDIETAAGQITEVGFAWAPDGAVVIPFRVRGSEKNYWPTLEEEHRAWEFVRRVLATKPTVGQNFQYDMQYFYKVMGIPCPMWAGDTMLLHHSLQPELKKSLGFLGSIYTDEPSWKFMRQDQETLKKED